MYTSLLFHLRIELRHFDERLQSQKIKTKRKHMHGSIVHNKINNMLLENAFHFMPTLEYCMKSTPNSTECYAMKPEVQ